METADALILDGAEAYDSGLWRDVADLGWCGTAIPSRYGGQGAGHLELCIVAEELGRALAPIPFASSIYLAVELLLLAGSEQQKQQRLPAVAEGERIGTFALASLRNDSRTSALRVAGELPASIDPTRSQARMDLDNASCESTC